MTGGFQRQQELHRLPFSPSRRSTGDGPGRRWFPSPVCPAARGGCVERRKRSSVFGPLFVDNGDRAKLAVRQVMGPDGGGQGGSSRQLGVSDVKMGVSFIFRWRPPFPFLSSVRGISSNLPPSLRIAAAEWLGGGPLP
nr:hypothetical protein Iba_chr08fCG0580 [Ipomoea batatas]